MVYYRKYRSQTIAELDSPKLRETLYSVLSSKNIPHAFLFTGPKGLGKTSTARIIAKVLNCEHTAEHSQLDSGSSKDSKGMLKQVQHDNIPVSSIEPDNTCSQCVSITNGANIDVLEIDGASNRGIDEIRDLRDKIKLAPSSAHKKVYIIDEVHMLTTEAFNALLKTIEEPPSHVVFIFCTTEPQKVPPTIVSRCFHIALSKATEEEIVNSLKRIVDGEKLSIDEEALHTIAHMADGGYRDATKLLEEVISVANGKKIDKGFIENYYKITGVFLNVTDFLAYLKNYNVSGALHKVKQITEQGMDVKYFIEQVLSRLHAILLNQTGVEKSSSDLPELDVQTIVNLTELLSDAYQKTKYAVIPSLPLELAVVQFSSQFSDAKTDQPATDQQESKNRQQRMPNSHTMDTLLKKERNLKVQAVLKGTNVLEVSKDSKEEATHSQVDLPQNVNDVASLMENLIYKVKPYNHSVAGVLRGCIIRSLGDGKIVFETAYKFHKERLDDIKTKEILEKAMREITGKQLQVMVELKR